MRDFREGEREKFKNYPEKAIIEIPIKLWTEKEQEEYIFGRGILLQSHKGTPDDELPKCTKEEAWVNEKTKKPNKCLRYCSGNKFCNQFAKYLEGINNETK